MSKGSNRRRENTALVEANWDSIFGKAKDTEAQPPRAEASPTNDQPRELADRQDHR